MVLEDVNDGKNIKENSLLKSTPALSLIVYQVAFEVTNPLGSGKQKHKILAVYMSPGEIQTHNCSLEETTQLVPLCRENDFQTFGVQKVFSSITVDFKDLEDAGVDTDDMTLEKHLQFPFVEIILAPTVFVGFNENFSYSTFLQILLDQQKCFSDVPLKSGPKTIAEDHKKNVNQLSTTGQDAAQGVRFTETCLCLNWAPSMFGPRSIWRSRFL